MSESIRVWASLGIGIVDNILTGLEEKGIITGNMTYIKDAIRVGCGIGGLIYNVAIAKPRTKASEISEAIAVSALPLAMHSIRKLIESAIATMGYSTPEYTPVSAGLQTATTPPTPASRIVSY